MNSASDTVRRVLAGRPVQLAFAFVLGFWLVLETGWLPDPWYAPLYPFWLPAYLAIALASGVRNTVFSWLGSGVLFHGAIVSVIYLEAVVVAGLYRILRRVHRTYQRGREEQAAP